MEKIGYPHPEDFIPWNEVEEGSEYQFEDKYWLQAKRVRVLKKEIKQNGEYIRYQLEILEPYYHCNKGDVGWFAKRIVDPGRYLGAGMKFRKIGSGFCYMTPGDQGIVWEARQSV
jgi:hypothetical protein